MVKVKWNFICYGIGAAMLAVGMTIGLVLPRETFIDNVFTQFYLLIIIMMAVSSLITVTYGLAK